MPIHCSAVLRKPNGPLRREQRTKRDINSSCFCSPSAACITGLLLSGGIKQGRKNAAQRHSQRCGQASALRRSECVDFSAWEGVSRDEDSEIISDREAERGVIICDFS